MKHARGRVLSVAFSVAMNSIVRRMSISTVYVWRRSRRSNDGQSAELISLCVGITR